MLLNFNREPILASRQDRRSFINLTPFKHPEKSLIFLGTRFIPLSLKRRGGGEER
jgi:hypothetical protein